MDYALVSLAAIIVTGVCAQWLAWRFHLPSILLLLAFGFILGRGVDPDRLFGDLLMPFVSASVALILFEGGLELRLSELRQVGRSIISLVTLGIMITWAMATTAAWFFLDIQFQTALLMGAILVVTGPTVVGPLLRQIRPKGQVGAVLRWEGILNDAVGAVLAVLVFEAILAGQLEDAPIHIALGVLKTLLLGLVVGLCGGGLLVLFLRRRWIPDHLDVAVTFAFVLAAFAASNYFQHESGLLTVTVMGIYVVNQKQVDVRHLIEFKENLRVLLLSTLFVLLAARLEPSQLAEIGLGTGLFVGVLILVVRPLVVMACTWGNNFSWQEKVFMSSMAPRGIVAAAVASVFGLRMAEGELADAALFAPTVFFVIAATVAIYGLIAGPLARRLGLAQHTREGVVIVGAHILPRQIALTLQAEGFKLLLIDINRRYVRTSRLAGLDAMQGDALSEHLVEELDLTDMGRLFAFTANDTVNSLSALHFAEVFGRDEVYQVAQAAPEVPGGDEPGMPRHLRGRTLFGAKVTHADLVTKLELGATVKVTKLTSEFGYDDYCAEYGERAVALFLITEEDALVARTEQDKFEPRAGQRVVALVSDSAVDAPAPS